MKLLYELNDRPPAGSTFLLALQHMLASIGGIIAVPLIVGSAIGLPAGDVVTLINAALFVSGAFTIVQCLGLGPVGIRLPVVMGSSFAFLGIAIGIGKADGVSGIMGAALVGACLVIVSAFFMEQIRKLFPPVVSGVVVTLIGLTILPVAMNWIGDAPAGSDQFATLPKLFLAAISLLVVLLVSTYAKGGVAASAIVIGLAGGYLVALSMGMVNLDQLHNSSWFAAPEPFKFGLSFSWPAIIGMCLAYIVVIAEATGDFLALASNCHRTISGKDLKRGLLGDGIGSAVGSLFGAMPLASFSQNVGIVGITGVASRFVVGTTGALLILAGLFPKFGALAVSVPKPVLGGVGFVMFGMIAYAGIRMLVKAADTRRNALVICVSLAAGLAVTIKPSLLQHLHHDIAQLLHSGITTGTIVAVMLNLVLPKSKEDVTAEREAEEEEMNSEHTQPLNEDTADPVMVRATAPKDAPLDEDSKPTP
ncbi:xanthine permease [Enterovibrio norvegicus FF-33]|uniref:Xanthine permease n=1 Tax=Enterovibrio norvegicus FF-454 TaxID=1185651 RepID=A0A1E5CC94_9GAMM|nr:nucleobase:cation symporter-2 family protein [Enterovibrio norvegicus]OEE63075.1 xanthine permease [Enterovibrio norvegicus FF-454]OEE66998.1 xanthine permease [Enterovibrio norvegicus FF-33]OEE74699.1 xanthine permease [Enterovibrio norvegicus FF-162]